MKKKQKILGVILSLLFLVSTLAGCTSSNIIVPPAELNRIYQIHRVANIDTTVINTWINITWDMEVPDETTEGFTLVNDNQSIEVNFTGIVRVQGCLHPKNNGVGNEEAVIAGRTMIDGIEARCLQITRSKSFKAAGFDTVLFEGTVFATKGDWITIQYNISNVNVDFEGLTTFDSPVAASVNFECIDI